MLAPSEGLRERVASSNAPAYSGDRKLTHSPASGRDASARWLRRFSATLASIGASHLVLCCTLLVVSVCTAGVLHAPFASFTHSRALETEDLITFRLPQFDTRLRFQPPVSPGRTPVDVTVVVAVRGKLPPPEFVAALMQLDAATQLEVVFALGNVHRSDIDALIDDVRRSLAEAALFVHPALAVPPLVVTVPDATLAKLYEAGLAASQRASSYVLVLASFVTPLAPRQFLQELIAALQRKIPCSPSSAEIFGSGRSKVTGGRRRRLCVVAAVQCTLLEDSREVDVLRSSPYLVADAGWHVDLGTMNHRGSHFDIDETLYLSNREVGTPWKSFKATNDGVLRLDAASASCLMLQRDALNEVGAFSSTATALTDVDCSLAGMPLPHTSLRILLEASVTCRRTWVKLETVVKVDSLGAEHRALLLRSMARTWEAMALYEALAKVEFTDEIADQVPIGTFARPLRDGSYDLSSRVSDPCLRGEWTAHIACTTDRLEQLLPHGRELASAKLGDGHATAVPEAAVGWVPTLRMRSIGWLSVVSPAASALVNLSSWPPSVQHVTARLLATPSVQVKHTDGVASMLPFLRSLHPAYAGRMLQKLQGDTLVSMPRPDADFSQHESFVRLVWYSICCGCCGFSAEIAHFARPLSRKYPVSLTTGPECFCPGMPLGFSDSLARMHLSEKRFVAEELFPGEMVVWISHTDPRSYLQEQIFGSRKPHYLVGRSMYELTRVPSEWERYLNIADEIWVPSQFALDLFVHAGCHRETLHVIPEGIDTNFFSPDVHQPLRFVQNTDFTAVGWRHVYCNRDSFWAAAPTNSTDYYSEPGSLNEGLLRDWAARRPIGSHSQYKARASEAPAPYEFFSTFKWEPRKGWEFLFEAFFRDFYDSQSTEDVTLLVLTYMYFPQGTPQGGSVYTIYPALDELAAAVGRWFPGKTVHDMPRFCLAADPVSEFELAQLFRGADAFVLPTRGEGWGLPTMQAMAMALPVISTNFGGSVDFTAGNATFLIELRAIEEVPADSPYGYREGSKWATPSVKHLRKLMRYVHENQEHARDVGTIARQHIVANFDEAVVAGAVDRRLDAIANKLSARTRV